MATIRRRLKLKLEGDHLYVRRLDKDGQSAGPWTKWKIQGKSLLPKGLYFLIHGFVRHSVQGREGDSFASVKKAVLRSLHEAASACGCQAEFGKEGGDLCWFLDGQPFFAFQIHDKDIDKFRLKYMRKGNAVLRWALIVGKGGYVRYDPRSTRLGVEKGR